MSLFQANPKQSRPVQSAKANFAVGITVAGVLILIISLVNYFRPSRTSGVVPPIINQPMSDFVLTDLTGKWVHLSDYFGQVILINTWATWCPPCRSEMPDLNAFYQQYHDRGFVVLAVNAGEAPSTVAVFVTENRLTFPVLVDPDYRVLDGLKIDTYPTSILVDRNGIVRDIRVGVHTPETLAEKVLPLLTEN